jgi:hypothetical protein
MPTSVPAQRSASAARAPACGACRHFRNEPLALEAASPGLAVLSSGFAAVGAQDGLCDAHGRYVAIIAHCASFAARGAPSEPVSRRRR